MKSFTLTGSRKKTAFCDHQTSTGAHSHRAGDNPVPRACSTTSAKSSILRAKGLFTFIAFSFLVYHSSS